MTHITDVPYAAAAELAGAADFDAAVAVIARSFHHLCANAGPGPGRGVPPPRSPDGIGPWRRREDGAGVWFTKEPDTPWGWAAVDDIPERKRGRRVVLIGESVARAFMLDPLFNCAGVLQSICDGAAGDGTVEIVDLAKNGMPPPQAVELLEASARLDPDLYVVFAGNNLLAVNGVYDFPRAAMALERSGSWRGVAEYARDAAARQARRFITQLAAAARGRRVPLLYVVPPYNQRDWAPCEAWTNPLLTPIEQRVRSGLLQRAERLLGDGHVAEAEEAAREVLRLEEDVSPCALRLLARAALANEDLDKAAELFDAATDALMTLPAPSLLVTSPGLARAFREQCAAEDVPIVDLPCLLRQKQGGVPLGRELFLDHVHLSHAGVRLAMAGVAERLLPLLGLPGGTRTDLIGAAHAASADAAAQGHFLAAGFNAYYGQSLDLIRYHTECAIEASADITTAMEVHVHRSVRRAPDLLCPGRDDIRAIGSRFTGIVWSLARPAWHWKRPHLGLLRLWTEVLRTRSASSVPPFEPALAAHRGVGAANVDLLDCQQPDGQPIGLPYRRSGVLTARDAESAFWFCWDRSSEWLHLRITSRVPAAAAGRTVTLTVNGEPVHAWPGTARWCAIECVIPGDALNKGVNILGVDWPDFDESRQDRARQLTAFLAGMAPVSSAVTADRQMYSVRGEVCVLSAATTSAPPHAGALHGAAGVESALRA